MASTFQRSRVLLTACELGLFTALAKASRSSAEAARALGADGRATDRLMNALCAGPITSMPDPDEERNGS
jgi:hypothetical protein